MEWEQQRFGRWLRKARVSKLPVLSQDRVAELVGVTQAKISRWEMERPGSEAPTLEECLHLADLFDVDFIELATLCGRWNERLEERVLLALAAKGRTTDNVDWGPPSPSRVVPLSAAPSGRQIVDYGHSPQGSRPKDSRPSRRRSKAAA